MMSATNEDIRRLYGFMESPDRRKQRGVERREVTGARKVGDPVELAQRHHEILNLSLLGLKNVDIAAQLNVTPQSVTQIVNSSLGQEKLRMMRMSRDAEAFDVRKELDKLLPQAVEVYQHILSKDSEASLGLKKKTADTLILDVAGHRAPTKFQGAVVHLDSAMLDELKKRGREAGIVIDVPFTTSEHSEPKPVATSVASYDGCADARSAKTVPMDGAA